MALDVPSGTKVVRIEVLRKTGRQTRTVGIALRNPARTGRHRYRLTERALRRLKAGRYEVGVRVGRSRGSLGPAERKSFRIAKARR